MRAAREVAIDLGTANTLVYVPERGIVVNEPSVIAVDERDGDVVAIGDDAWRAASAEPGRITAVRPLRHGAITDFELTERLLRLVFQRIGVSRFSHPRALIAVSSAITPVERRAVQEAAMSAGARSATLIDEPMAAAIGAGLPIDQPWGNCIIDVGGGTTEVAVISMGGVVSARAARVGGFDLDDAVRVFLRTTHGLVVGDRTAEEVKKAIGSAFPTDAEPKAEVSGRDLASGMPKTVVLGAQELRGAIDEHVRAIIDAVRGALSTSPPELSHDVLERGMTLTGGGALLRGLDARLADETEIQVNVAESPLDTVVLGAGRALASVDKLRERGILSP